VAKAGPSKPRAAQPAPVVVADATLPPPRVEAQAEVASAVEAARPVAPQAAAPEAAAAPAQPMAEAAVPAASGQAEALARVDLAVAARARIKQSLAASAAAESRTAKAHAAADAVLLRAVGLADLKAARSALQAGASVDLRDAQGRTVLMLAARAGARDMVDLLLAAGARKGDRDTLGATAADHAQSQGHADLANSLR
jgi:hypothetical protein